MKKRTIAGVVVLATSGVVTAFAQQGTTPAPKTVADCIAQPEENIRSCANRLEMTCSMELRRVGTANADGQRKTRAGAERAAKACAAAIESQVSEYLAAEQTCVANGAMTACMRLPDDTTMKKCFARCVAAREATMSNSASTERDACIGRYVEANGKGRFSCSLQGAPAKAEDAAALKAAMTTDLPKALKDRNGAALESLMKRSDAQFLSVLEEDCTKKCTQQGPDALVAQKQGPALVTAYKRCMVAADSTAEARKLNAYELDLYCDYIGKANDRCRTASKCDLVEKNSELECSYATPGTTCPM